MRIKDFTDTIRHLTDPFNIPEARRMIQENPALTQEQFVEGGRVGFAYGDKVKKVKEFIKGKPNLNVNEVKTFLKDIGYTEPSYEFTRLKDKGIFEDVVIKPSAEKWEHLQKVGRKSPGLDKLKEWITQQPDGTTLHSDDLVKVAKENNWKINAENVRQFMRSSNITDTKFWDAQRKRLNFETGWTEESIKSWKEAGKKAGKATAIKQKIAFDVPRTNLDEFVEGWIKNNLNNYDITEFDRFKVDLKNATLMETGEDVAREARFGRLKYKVEGFRGFSPILNDFPNIRAREAGGTKFFEVFGVSQSGDNARHLPMTFNKIFYKGKLDTNPQLRKELTNYIDYVNMNKTGMRFKGTSMVLGHAQEHNRYYTKGVKELLNGLATQQKKSVLSSVVGENNWNKFSKKTGGTFTTGYTSRVQALEKLIGQKPGTHANAIARLRNALNKTLGLREMKAQIGVKGFKKVKDWLPSFDHHINVAFAQASKNPVIAKTALDNISLVPAKDNMVKGFSYDGDKLFNGAVYEYENALPKEKLSKLDNLKNVSDDMGIKFNIEGGKVIPSPVEDLSKRTMVQQMDSYVSQLLKQNPNIINDPNFQLLPKDYRDMIIKYKGGDLDYLAKFRPGLEKIKPFFEQAGVKPTDNKIMIISKIKKAPIPGKIKNILLATIGGYGAITGADLLTGEVQAATESGKVGSILPTAAAGVAGAAGLGTKTGRSILGKTFRTLGTPLSGLGWAGLNVYDKMKEGKSLTDAVVDPLTGVELAFPSLFKENLSKIIPDKYQGALAKAGRGALGLGKFGARFMGPIGWGITAAGLGKEAYKVLKEDKARRESITPEQRRRAQREYFDKDEPMFAEGGIAGLLKK